MSDSSSVKRFENDWSQKELTDIYKDIASAVTLPINVEIRGNQRVLDLSSVERLLRGAHLITLSTCGCRKARHNCSAPIDVCISIDDNAEKTLENSAYNARRATLQEALHALRRSHEADLVHMAYTMEGQDKPTIICSCCSCCCHTLSGLIRFGIAEHVVAADMIAKTDPRLCTDSGLCVGRCQFGARRMIEGRMSFDPKRCFGCGLCVSTCPSGAITLVRRK